ncbi:hypothetical protein [Burkholderia gladioli]|uniref:hypothetical protein n=3 Tax=Burkholderia gladioli TaxID=28095 RepID=UPI000FDB2FB6|nr:hypothetical protein [Burkholderia gladioli]MBU9427281.1 hypothetical protein [Burkholderia gladioli]MDN8064356.1 hypothetical protein [Burkholderia gladioli]
MNKPSNDLPQDWPQHLTADATVSPVNTASPIGDHVLDFRRMHSDTFEQFCWWLLRKDHSLTGCKRLGGNGLSQEGIDLFAFDEQMPDRLNVFECKAWQEFGPTNLTKAVSAFLNGSWASLTNRFTIILAQEDIGTGALAQRWLVEKERLKQAGIEGDIWTAHTLTLRAQLYPDILTKFFPWIAVETFANQWMERVAFYELVSKAFFDPREYVASWARDLSVKSDRNGHADVSRNKVQHFTKPSEENLHDSPEGMHDQQLSFDVDGTYRDISQYGDSWHFRGPWFSLSTLLPGRHFTHASAAFNLNRPDVQGMTLTVDHKWLLQQFLFATGAPLTSRYRGFIAGSMPDTPDEYVVDFPHCRLTLHENGVQEIAEVADLLTNAARNSLAVREIEWSAVDFPFVNWAGLKVAMAAIDAGVWREIGLFAEQHDASKGTSTWHMFDGNSQVLKPFHNSANDNFDAGYHGIFYATEIDGLSYGREVVLLWQPNGPQSSQMFSPRGWWSCEFAFQWLNETLLPEIKRRVFEYHYPTRWRRAIYPRRAAALAAHLDRMFVARDLRRPPLICNDSWSCNILESVTKLQRFFHISRTPEPYIRQHEIEDLYRGVAVLAQGQRGYVGYARSKLGLDRNLDNHEDLIRAIHEYVHEGRVVANCAVADNAFRAMLEMLDDSDAWLSTEQQATVKETITPFARLRDDAVLVERHTKWL